MTRQPEITPPRHQRPATGSPVSNSLQARLRLRPGLALFQVDRGLWFLVGDGTHLHLEGAAYDELLPGVKGERTLMELMEALPTPRAKAEGLYLLNRLWRKGFLEDVDGALRGGEAPVSEEVEDLPALPGTPLEICLQALVGVPDPSVGAALKAQGFSLGPKGRVRALLLPAQLNGQGLARLLELSTADLPVLPLHVRGRQPAFGPLFGSHKGPCPSCLHTALGLNRPVEAFLARQGLAPTLRGPALGMPHLTPLAQALLWALERWQRGDPSKPIWAHRWVFEGADRGFIPHPIRHFPQCFHCGEAADRSRVLPVTLEAAPITGRGGTGFRSAPPEVTFDAHKGLISPISGVVSSFGRLNTPTGGPGEVFAATVPCAPPGPRPSQDDFHLFCIGKGMSPEQARMSALGEALERHSALWRGDEAVFLDSANNLGGDAVPLDTWLLFSDTQQARAPIAHPDTSQWLPPPCPRTQRIPWIWAWSLTHNRPRALPAGQVYLRCFHPSGAQFARGDSNGLAAGATREGAILQALFELVERDATAVWWYNRIQMPGVDLSAYHGSELGAWLRSYDNKGIMVHALDLSQDLGIPVVAAIAEEAGRRLMGFGAHLDPDVALGRALGEVEQLRHATVRKLPWEIHPLPKTGFLSPAPEAARSDAYRLTLDPAYDLRGCIELCVSHLRSLGLEVIVVDLTRPDVGLPVVRVVVPGLRHIWPRFAPGRLFDVPVAMGWRAEPLNETDLNPCPLLL